MHPLRLRSGWILRPRPRQRPDLWPERRFETLRSSRYWRLPRQRWRRQYASNQMSPISPLNLRLCIASPGRSMHTAFDKMPQPVMIQ
ncbi:hypothetical protein IG631_09611 [Alternaria alternata]|nr:hypothetical protein IG631_09611 [Alternaria alternata]